MATPSKKPSGPIVKLTIDRWVHGGRGMARDGEGRVIFVTGVVPGDVVDVRLTKRKKRWGRGEAIAVVESSASRRAGDLPCGQQTMCGGCPWMAGTDALQREQRVRILNDEIAKQLSPETVAAVSAVDGTGEGAPRLGYRIRARWAYRRGPSGWTLGYRKGQSSGLVSAALCPVVVPEIRALHPLVLEALSSTKSGVDAVNLGVSGEVWLLAGPNGDAGAVIVSDSGGRVVVGSEVIGVDLTKHLPEALQDLVASGPLGTLALSPVQFSQANLQTTADIWTWIYQAAADAAEFDGQRHAVEFFAGHGTFTSALLAAGFSVDAYDTKPAKLTSAVVSFHGCDLFATGVPLPAPRKAAGLVVLDPPRAGAAELLDWIAASTAKTVLYVSCDLATAMRDAATLSGNGFRLAEAVSFDMFPHTGHQEVALRLVRTTS